jgi:BMFP domain-containing protein YqiC
MKGRDKENKLEVRFEEKENNEVNSIIPSTFFAKSNPVDKTTEINEDELLNKLYSEKQVLDDTNNKLMNEMGKLPQDSAEFKRKKILLAQNADRINKLEDSIVTLEDKLNIKHGLDSPSSGR